MGHHHESEHHHASHSYGHSSEPAPTYGHSEPTPAGDLVKIYSEANPHYNLTAQGNTVVLAKADDHNAAQQWYKDGSNGSKVKDDAGQPAFVLINKATRLALKHVGDETVTLGPFHDNTLDTSVLWTLSDDVGSGYHAIRPVSNSHLNLDADHADKEHGGVKDNNKLILYKWNKGENQKWKVVSI